MRPADQLEGRDLSGGWRVLNMVKRKPTATGGHFSTGYVVENADGRRGYLKAMDYMEALRSSDTAQMLNFMTEAYLFEKRICDRCREHRLKRVVHAIDSGSILTESTNPAAKVEYLIFELADGDIRAHLDAQDTFDYAFVLRTLHNVAVGLNQLHRADIAHQDLKPSNVLVFPEDAGAKVSDLGRAWAKSVPAPHDGFSVAGDPGYAPPELIYGYVSGKITSRRFGCDTYHFGSLIVFFFARVHMNALLTKHLPQEYRPGVFPGSYENVLPYLKAAFGEAIDEFRQCLPDFLRCDLAEMVTQLCEPDPSQRGHPKNRIGYTNPHALDRYVSRLNLLARKTAYGLLS